MAGTVKVVAAIAVATVGIGIAVNAGSSGYELPHAVTTGVASSLVTQANIQSTICVSGYTARIRPSTSYTNNLKRKQLSGVYADFAAVYGNDLAGYEEDHLIPLELGGSPKAEANLFPQPYVKGAGARMKDRVENKLHDMVCSGQIPLKTAQYAIAHNWVQAFNSYVTN